MTTIAVMQPYFAPYAGYFRLFAAADLFVVYDCVQFPRRGWVHRNRLADAQHNLRWLTLPVASCPRETAIFELQFRVDAAQRMRHQERRFPCLSRGLPAALQASFADLSGSPVDYICRLLRVISRLLGVERPIMRSSELELHPALRGEERVLEIVRRLGATRYINAPGGRALYSARAFAQSGVALSFLSDYHGAKTSILERLAMEPSAAVAREIQHNLELCAA